ncbi:L,D-transpeptidase family protein [Sphingomonas mucosissima]|uniref:Murein L,D-transpeptidase n=1 Tax=Sphingomonas mucosissima TaxID=370959 RepID=A0A245ZJA5_9SPHN|nr:L,D-transpeptidase family protein [Sphingomonas mucosissima]OWK29830.1 murein L,D-transpeptidase [Sphingomonas mucosissima]
MSKYWVGTASALALLAGCNVQDQPAQNAATSNAEASQNASWDGKTTDQLRKAIANRAAHGLDGKQFAIAGDGQEALTQAALAYAAALARGATDPTKLYDVYTVPRPEGDLRAGLQQALANKDVAGWLNSLAPQDANYRRLSQVYLELRKQPAQAQPAVADTGDAIKPGSTDPRVPHIARQLAALDYLDAGAAQGDRYTPAMVAAVKKMQSDYGMESDGVIGAEALAILNQSDDMRARAIAVNMERLRWLERSPPQTRIDVNVAAARLSYWRDGKLVNSRRVVVGEPDTETPQLGSPMFRLVANPTWTVPRSIQEKEIANKGPGYLKANNMVWKDGWIVQEPGPKNSLGLVKFDMQNEHAIYLHDTPAKPLFAMVQRARSHGCVRVEDALGFAQMLAEQEGVVDEWNKARATGKETFVKLPRQIPVRMLYQTVLFDDSGAPIVRNDPYGWNDRVSEALGFKGPASMRVKTGAADVGP